MGYDHSAAPPNAWAAAVGMRWALKGTQRTALTPRDYISKPLEIIPCLVSVYEGLPIQDSNKGKGYVTFEPGGGGGGNLDMFVVEMVIIKVY